MNTAARNLATIARVFARAWWRSALVVLGLCLVGAVALWAYARTIGPQIFNAISGDASTVTARVAVSLVTMLPILLLFGVLGSAWAGAVTLLSDRAQRGLPVSTFRAVGAGARRSLVALVIGLAWFAAILLAIVVTPLLVVGGLVGLVVALATRRNVRPAWLPSVPLLWTLAVPLGGVVLVAVRLSRALPATWIDERGIRESLRSSWADTKGKVWSTGLVLVLATVSVALVTLVASQLSQWLTTDPLWSAIAQIIVQGVLGSIPIIALAVLYRSDRGGGSAPADARVVPIPGARIARIAGATAAVVVVQAIGFVLPAAPAQALDFSTPTVTVSTAPSHDIIAGTEMAISIRVQHATDDAADPPTGTVAVTLNGVPVPGTHTLDDGHVSIAYSSGLAVGTYDVEVAYGGDTNYSTATGSTTFAVSSAASLGLVIDDDSILFGDALHATAHISVGGSAQGGTVAFTATPSVGDLVDLGTATIDASGDAIVETSTLPPGDYTLGAVYQGDAGGSVMSSPGRPFTVAAHFTLVDAVLSPTSSPGAPSAPGGTVTATVTVDAIDSALLPTGSIEIFPDGGGDLIASGPLVNGVATLTMVLPPGAPVIRVNYVGGTGFYASATTAQQYVGFWTSALGLTGPASSGFGDAVTLTATATSTETPTGTVSFYVTPDGGSETLLGSGTLNGSGVATFSATGLNPGDYHFSARYSGDGTAAAATASGFDHTVGAAPATVTLTLGGSHAAGGVATASVAVTSAAGTASGTVAIYVDSVYFGTVTLDVAGHASLNLPAMLPGPHQVRAAYGGNAQVAAGEDTQTFAVDKAVPLVVLGGALFRSATYGDSQVYAGSVTGVGPIATGAVQLWADGYLVGTATLDALGNYSVTTTTIPALPPPAHRAMVVEYLGDSAYEPGQSADAVVTEVDLADAVPVVTLGPGTLGIGGNYTLKAALPASATGTVTFHVTGGADIGPIALVGGAASATFLITDANTYVTASYGGDANFTPQDSAVTTFTADRSAATVQLLLNPPSDPNVFAYGNTFELVARVTIAGGLETDGLVTFKTAGGMTIAANVPTTFFPSQGYGLARVTVCAGDVAGCPLGMPTIGVFDQQLLADYPESTVNLAATSSPIVYSMTKAPTTTSLVVNPTSVQVGSAIFFTATVANPAGGPTPIGEVSFYGVEMTPSGPAEAFIGSASTVNGVAMLTANVGSGPGDLRWPASQVVARFFDVDAHFGSSNQAQTLAIARAGTSVTVTSGAVSAGVPTTLTAAVSHVPGYSANYDGQLQFFVDGAATPACTPLLTGAATSATCVVTFSTPGAHTVVAKYLGDLIYAPSDSAATPVTVGTSVTTPNLYPVVPTNIVALTPQTVTWTPGALTGTVTVYGGGSLWCTTSVTAGSCSGTFSNDDAIAPTTNIVIQYSGDASHTSRQYDLGVFVTACRIVDVYSTSTARGTVTVSPAPSCGVGGYPVGTSITATAHPIAPNAFLRWRGFTKNDAGLVTLGTALTSTFTVTNDSWTWVRVADFELPCYVITQQLTGHGLLYASAQPNCTTLAGTAGYSLGTTVTFEPIGLQDPAYGVPDVFYSFGTLPAGATAGTSKSGWPIVTLTATADAVLPVVFGTRCVQVAVTGNPVSAGDSYSATTAPNCFQPGLPGYLPTTDVTVTAASGDPALLVGGWSTSQADTPSLPPGPNATLTLGTADVTVTANWVACYSVNLVVDAPTLYRKGVGAVVPKLGGGASLGPGPNCPDGSARYLAGTQVTATPSIEVTGVIFRGWDGDTTAGNGGLTGEGALTNRTKTVTVTGPTTMTASFYVEEGCSILSIVDRDNSVSVGPTGCGVGQYADNQKAYAAALGQKQSDLWQDRYRSAITVTKKPGVILDVYASVRGDARTCFGSQVATSGPTVQDGWRSLGKLRNGPQDCLVGGNITLRFEQCQTVSPTVAIVREDDPEAIQYSPSDLPEYLLVPTVGGNFAPKKVSDFKWVQEAPVEYSKEADDFQPVTQNAGACRDAGNAFQPGMVLQVGADSISQGISFVGWTSDADNPLVPSNPVLMETTDTRRELPVSAAYEMTCNHVTFGEGITIEGSAPRCPGFSDEDNMFIAGTGIQIRAAQHVGKRAWAAWTSGVVAATTIEDPDSGERTAIAYVNGDMKVSAQYPTDGEVIVSGIANAGKIMAGVAAVLAPVALGIACPPCGIALAVVGVAGAISSLIPGGGDVAAFFTLINPTKITECAASWAFGKEEAPKPTDPNDIAKTDAGYLVKTGAGLKKVVAIIKPPPTAAELALAATKGATTSGKILSTLKAGGKATMQVAAVGYGLYSAGIANADLGFQTTDQLRDTKNMTNCLDDAWKFAK